MKVGTTTIKRAIRELQLQPKNLEQKEIQQKQLYQMLQKEIKKLNKLQNI